jgi:ATP synthase delta (OSCP) subunit
VGANYAIALVELASEADDLEKVHQDMDALASILSENAEVTFFIAMLLDTYTLPLHVTGHRGVMYKLLHVRASTLLHKLRWQKRSRGLWLHCMLPESCRRLVTLPCHAETCVNSSSTCKRR